jgi:hypothetical protein
MAKTKKELVAKIVRLETQIERKNTKLKELRESKNVKK